MLGFLRVLMVIFYCFFCKFVVWAVIAVCRARVLWGKGKFHWLVSPHSPAPLYNLCLQQAVQTPVRDGFHALSPLQDGRFPKGPSELCFRRKDSFKAPSSSLTKNKKRKEFDPQSEHWCHLKAEDWMFLNQCSWGHLLHSLPSRRCSIPFTKATFPWLLPILIYRTQLVQFATITQDQNPIIGPNSPSNQYSCLLGLHWYWR